MNDKKQAKLNQVIKELESIDQKQIDVNPHYFQSRQFIDRLVHRLGEV